MTATIAAVIPTRNRSEIAIRAVRSLLDQDCAIDVFLSDNSTSPDRLRTFSRTEPRVHYLRPDRELPMAEHWDWALRQAMARSQASHFTVHYDRKYSKPGHWGGVAALAAQWPGRLITYPIDMIVDEPPPLRLWQASWTGKAFIVQTAWVARLAASGRVQDAGHAIPVLSNCIVPREILESIIDRFGDACVSIGCDSCFSARFLALCDDYLHYDRALAVSCAPHRSAGLGFLSGGGRDFGDFRKMWGDRPWLDASPVAGVNLGQNMYLHEYELVRRMTGDRLPPLDRKGCLDHLGEALIWVRDEEQRAAYCKTLEEHGWTGKPPPVLRRSLMAMLSDRLAAFRIRYFGFVPQPLSGSVFPDDEVALLHALSHPLPSETTHHHLPMPEPVEAGPP